MTRTEGSPFFHLHAHSEYSVLDGMCPVPEMVRRVAANKQPGLALTDHGVMSGCIDLYRSCKDAGIKPFPGQEFYVVTDRKDLKAPRYHLTMLALNYDGYRELAGLSSFAQERANYHYRPRIDFADLASASSKNIAVLTGCHFGLVIQHLIARGEDGKWDEWKQKKQAAALVMMLKKWFPHTFVEVQQHNRPAVPGEMGDYEIILHLMDIADHLGLTVAVTQDAHYCESTQKPLHDLMKEVGYQGTEDASFPGDPYHLASTWWMKRHYRGDLIGLAWLAGERACEELLNLHEVRMAAADAYSFHIPKPIDGMNLDGWLHVWAKKGLNEIGLRDPFVYRRKTQYLERLDRELAVIKELGFAGYFRLIWEGTQFCKQQGIWFNARGSSNGSLTCYLLGITGIDPIKWDLLFERFLARDRKKPPDIDLDIEDTRRDEVVEFYRTRYSIVQLGTYGRLGETEGGRGSILVSYLAAKRKKLGPERYAQAYGNVATMYDLPRDVQSRLHELAAIRVRKSAGAHAAGFVIGTSEQPIDAYLPTMLIPSSGSVVTQMTMDAVESLGYVKMDLLGQRTLTTLKRCVELLGRALQDGLDWIPDNDKETLKALRSGVKGTGIFQFEGGANAFGAKQVQVRSVRDCVAVQALYRPATLDSGYTELYLKNRRAPKSIKYPHPIFEKRLKETYGVAIYQEQVMSILRDLGMPEDRLNSFLSALKMSNDKSATAQAIFTEQREFFLKLSKAKGMRPSQARLCWDEISGFAGYGFNRAHATAYGVLGYRAAYLKVHHPLEFMAALLETTAGTPKESGYTAEARRIGVKLLGADVNVSGVSWTLDRKKNAIRRGLSSIKGVGTKAAESIISAAPFTDLQDLITRTDPRLVTGGKEWAKTKKLRGVLEALRQGGALRSIGAGY